MPDRTPYCHKIRYGITGAPLLDEDDMDGSFAPGVGVEPALIELIYSQARDDKPATVSASITGWCTRFGKREQPERQMDTHFKNGPVGWPAWLAEEARLHDPAAAEARPPQHSWRVETRDPLADEWAPGSHFASRPHAVERYETANSRAPMWKDGTPVERRIVRETTTYTVEKPQPAAAPQPETLAPDRIVAHVPAARNELHCLRCAPLPLGDIWTPVTSENLEDGGICTECGTDVLLAAQAAP